MATMNYKMGTTNKSSIMPPSSKKRKHKKKRPIESVAALYVEDIGTQGVKQSGTAVAVASHQNGLAFRVKVDKKEKSKRKQRMERFSDQDNQSSEGKVQDTEDLLGSALATRRSCQLGIVDARTFVGTKKLVGLSTALEKPYMRLTTYPKAENVRPLSVLKKSLAHIKSQFIQNEDFDWANEQLKSVRQDITVQHLRCPFVVEVYETHARILLEHGDLNEFNQCQTMIRSMTSPREWLEDDNEKDSKNLEGNIRLSNDNVRQLRQSEESADEFQAYRVLYDLVQHSWSDLALALSQYVVERDSGRFRNHGDTYHSEIPEVSRGSSSRHALNVVKAVMHNDYQTFFRLYESAPHLSAYLMDFLVRRVRIAAYERIIAAYRPTISVEHFREVLVFRDLEETRRFLKKNAAVFVTDTTGPAFWVDCKASFAVLNRDGPGGSV